MELITSVPMLPALVNEFQAVSVWIPDLGSVVSWVIMKLWPRRMDDGCTVGKSSLIGLLHNRSRPSDETDVNRASCRFPLPQPEKHATSGAEAFEIRMAGRSILPVIIDAACNAEVEKYGFVESNRTIDCTYRQKDMIKHKISSDTVTIRNFEVLVKDPAIVVRELCRLVRSFAEGQDNAHLPLRTRHCDTIFKIMIAGYYDNVHLG